MSLPKKTSFTDLMANLAQFSKNPSDKNKLAALGDGLDQKRKEEGISAPPNEPVVNELTHLNGGAEASKRESDVNPQGVQSGEALPDQRGLKQKEREREEKPFNESASVSKEAAPESAQEILARFKSGLKLASQSAQSGSPVAEAVLEGKPAPQTNAPVVSEAASRTLQGAAQTNDAGTSPEAKAALEGGKVAAADVDMDALAQKVAAWQQHGEFGYQAGKQFFGDFARTLEKSAALSPAAIIAELKVAEYQPLVPDRAALEKLVLERSGQLKTAGKREDEISLHLKEAGEADRQRLDWENAVRLDERQKVAAELEVQAFVIGKVAQCHAAGMTEEQTREYLKKQAEMDAKQLMAGDPAAAGADPAAMGGAPGGDPAAMGGDPVGGIDPAMLAQLDQEIKAMAAQMGCSEEEVLAMLEQQVQQGGGDPSAQGGAGAAPGGDPAAGMDPAMMAAMAGGAPGGPTDPAAGGMPPGMEGAPMEAPAGPPQGGSEPKEEKDDKKDKEPKEDKGEEKEARAISPEVEDLFVRIDALSAAGKIKSGAAQKVARQLVADLK
jgi:hypothetical protein